MEGTTAGRVQRRVAELDLIHQAMVLAALTMTLLIPALITLGAVIPLGDPSGIAPLVARRLGLSAQATRDFQSLFGWPGGRPVQQQLGERRRHGAVGLRLAHGPAEGLPARVAPAVARDA